MGKKSTTTDAGAATPDAENTAPEAVPAPAPEPTGVDAWAAAEVAKYRKNIDLARSQADLDPEIRQRMQAGLTFDQAVEVTLAQRRHDAERAETQPAKSE